MSADGWGALLVDVGDGDGDGDGNGNGNSIGNGNGNGNSNRSGAAQSLLNSRIPRKRKATGTTATSSLSSITTSTSRRPTGASQHVPSPTQLHNNSVKMSGRTINTANNPLPVFLSKVKQKHNRRYIVPDRHWLKDRKGDKKGDHDRGFETKSEKMREKFSIAASRKAWNGNNKKQVARGHYCTSEAIDKNHRVLIIDHHHTEIKITETDGTTHFVKVIRPTDSEDHENFGSFAASARELGKLWDEGTSNADRTLPNGNMFTIGVTPGAGAERWYYRGPTKQCKDGEAFQGLNDVHKALNISGKKICKKNFPRAYKHIRRALRNKDGGQGIVADFLGGEEGLCNDANQSGKNFVTEDHFDPNDSSYYSMVCWNSTDGSDPAGWYFYMPCLIVKVNGVTYSGIAVRLRDCIAIEWCGRRLRHGSTQPDMPDGVDVLGTWLGVLHYK